MNMKGVEALDKDRSVLRKERGLACLTLLDRIAVLRT